MTDKMDKVTHFFKPRTSSDVLSKKTGQAAANFLKSLSASHNAQKTFSQLLKKSKLSLEEVVKADYHEENEYYDAHACYFSMVDRPAAEEILQRNGNSEGLFLIRDSAKFGDFVLSMVSERRPVHFHIEQHNNSVSQYSMDSGECFDGLDRLITHYINLPDGLPTRLMLFCKKGMPLPYLAIKYGRTNVLHHVVKEGSIKLTRMVLESDRYENLNAKNAEGSTALHIAAFNGFDQICEILANKGADVNAKDASGHTPLHSACVGNKPSTISLLVTKYKADLQDPCCVNGMVPLHVAANYGHEQCVEKLLALKAPLRPKTDCGEIPLDLAEKGNHQACIDLLSRYKSPAPQTKPSLWYHQHLDRAQAGKVLDEHGMKNGMYLIRPSLRRAGVSVLTMVCDNSLYNYEIETHGSWVYIGTGPFLDSLEHLIEHYTQFRDGLPTTLAIPIRNPHYKPVEELSHSHNLSAFGVATARRRIPEIKRNDIQLGEEIGVGEYGSVLKGVWTDSSGTKREVAVKTLLEGHGQNSEFFREADVMMKLHHECIVELIGICHHSPVMIVQELLQMGSMLDFLLDHPNKVNPDEDLKLWAAQIACGMHYLEGQNFVHRDLAARNILLAHEQRAKISDFGLSRACKFEKDYYKATEGGRWPVKWYAPECIYFGRFTHASDVWSYGVTLWEMWTFGEQPYGEKNGQQVLAMIENKERLPRPSKSPRKIYEIMRHCWEYEPEKRPTFATLFHIFDTDPDYRKIRELIVPR